MEQPENPISTGQNPEEFYLNLSIKLQENHNFPDDYLYKFIFPNDKKKLTELYQIFDKIKYTISTRESKNGKYISTSILAFVLDSDQVIDLYKKVSQIEGVIML